MELRRELMPLHLDRKLVARLTELAEGLDETENPDWERDMAEFNRLAGTELLFEEFQGIYGAEDHKTWVRRVLRYRLTRPVPGVTREELVEIIRRAMPTSGYRNYEAYMAIFDANVSMPHASLLIYHPKDRRDWQTIGSYHPTPEEIVDEALRYHVLALPPPGEPPVDRY